MPQRVETKLVVTAEEKGFDRLIQKMLGINEKGLRGLKDQAKVYLNVQKEVKGLETQLGSLIKKQVDLSRQMETVDKASSKYKTLRGEIQEVTRESRDLERTIKTLERAYASEGRAVKTLSDAQRSITQQQTQGQMQSRNAMLQGFLQTALPGMAPLFLQRGPGMMRQMGGMALGRGARFGMGMAATPFRGIGGLAEAVSALPLGGVIGGQMMSAAQYAGQALQFNRQRLEMAPYLGTQATAAPTPTSPALERAEANLQRARLLDKTRRAVDASIDVSKQEAIGGMQRRTLGRALNPVGDLATVVYRGLTGTPLSAGLGTFGTSGEAPRQNIGQLQRTVERERAAARAGTIRGMGMDLRGLGPQEALQEAAAIVQATGGTIGGFGDQRGVIRAGMAAKTLFGVDTAVSGAFGLAGRRGGLAGTRGGGAEGLVSALRDALELGLEGAEINTHLQMIATGIQNFQTTGIPFNKESIKSMASEINRAGIGGGRAAAIAGGIQQYAQGMGARGPGGGFDLLMMQTMGGYKGGGIEGYVEAIMQLETMQMEGIGGAKAGSPMGNFLRNLIEQGGGGLGGTVFMYQQLKQRGIKTGMGEALAIGEELTGKTFMSPTMRETYSISKKREALRSYAGAELAKEKGLTGGVEGMAGVAKETVGKFPGLRAQAGLEAQQLAVGNRMMNVVKNLEKMALTTTTAFSRLVGEGESGGVVNRAVAALDNFAKALDRAASGTWEWSDVINYVVRGES